MNDDRFEHILTGVAMVVFEQRDIVGGRLQLAVEKGFDPASMAALSISRQRLADYLDLWRIASGWPRGTPETTLALSAEQWVMAHHEEAETMLGRPLSGGER